MQSVNNTFLSMHGKAKQEDSDLPVTLTQRVASWFVFSNQKSKFGQILEGLAMGDVVIFYGHVVHFTFFCYILWTFGVFCGILVYFSPSWYFVPRKIWRIRCYWTFSNAYEGKQSTLS
jgi:hypothetical protein